MTNPYAPPQARVEMYEAPVTDTEAFLMPCSAVKLVVLSVTTFNLYLIYWFWKNFRFEQRRNPEISPILRTIFSGFFFYSLARGTHDEADARGMSAGYSPAVLTGLLWGVAIGSRVLEDNWALMGLLIAFVAVPVQRAINRINAIVAPQVRASEGFSKKEIALAVPGALLLSLGLLGLLLS